MLIFIRGAFSVVKKVTSKRSGRVYAVKIIDKKNVGQDMNRLRIEIDILTKVKHPNIINLKEIMEDEDTLYIITELYVLFLFFIYFFVNIFIIYCEFLLILIFLFIFLE